MVLTTLPQTLLLFSASLITNALNGVAGGGSFISFPVLVLTGLSLIHANATNNIVTWVGYLASLRAYSRELLNQKQILLIFGSISAVGGAIGSLLLLHTPQTLFSKLSRTR